jgi:hypothetical protein
LPIIGSRSVVYALVGAGLLGCSGVDIVGDELAADAAVRRDDAGTAIGDAGHEGIACEASATVFDQALCACERASVFGNLAAATTDGTARAHVRINGPLEVVGLMGPLAGDLSVVGTGVTVLNADEAQLDGDLIATTDLAVEGVAHVAGDARLAGELFGEGRLMVGGQLRAEPFSAQAPCGCAEGERLDIVAWVESARANNDNAASGFTVGALAPAVLELPAGVLFVDELIAAGDLELEVNGKTSLFIAGALRAPGALRAQLGPEGELALFVAGDAELGGDLALAEPERAHAGRLYIAGALLRSDRPGGVTWVGNVYAPSHALTLPGHARVSGSLFVQSVVALGGLDLQYDPRASMAQERCDAE